MSKIKGEFKKNLLTQEEMKAKVEELKETVKKQFLPMEYLIFCI